MSTPSVVKLRSFVTLEKGKPPATQPYYGPDADRYLTPEYLRKGGECGLAKAAPRSARVKDGDTILLWDGSNAGEVLYGRCGILASTMSRASHAGRFDDAYFFYALKQWEPYLKGQTSGSGIPHIDKEIFGDLAIIEFNLCEQSKISEVLSTLDRVIEQTEALLAKLQRIRIGLMYDLLTRGIDEHGNLRSEETHKFKDSPVGRIPVKWKVRDLQSLLANVSFPMRSGPFGSALLKEELVDSGVPLLGIDNVLRERFVPDFRRFVSRKKAVQLRQYRVRPRDLMITIMGTVGRCCVVPESIGEALSSKHTWTLSLNQELYSPFLACLQINHSPWVHDHFARDEQGGIMASIRSETLRTTRLPAPPPPEMIRIEQVLRAATEDLRKIENTLGKVALLKIGLMQDLLTGSRRVTARRKQSEEDYDMSSYIRKGGQADVAP